MSSNFAAHRPPPRALSGIVLFGVRTFLQSTAWAVYRRSPDRPGIRIILYFHLLRQSKKGIASYSFDSIVYYVDYWFGRAGVSLQKEYD
jgi:hypothetical protein